LAYESLWGYNESPPNQAPQLELSHDQPCLDCLPQADFICKQKTHPTASDGPRQDADLMGQRDYAGFDWGQQRILGQRVSHPRGSGSVGNGI